MSMLIPPQQPQPPDTDAQAEADERLWQHYCAVAKRLDVGELLTAVCEQLRGELGGTPLSALLDDWLQLPQWDWQHPLLTPMQAESVGRYIAGIAALVVERAIATALAGLYRRRRFRCHYCGEVLQVTQVVHRPRRRR